MKTYKDLEDFAKEKKVKKHSNDINYYLQS